MRIYLLVCMLCLYSLFSYGKGIKYGKYSKEEMKLRECPYEKDAAAVILSTTCSVDVSYAMIYYRYHVRIKILKEEGLKYADVELPFFRKDNLESISGVKAQTVNFEEDGRKVVTPLSGKSVFTVDVDENYGEARFSMPNVKVGSIIEYRYTNNSKFYSYLDTWYFQSEIPTYYSSINVKVPDSFRYDMVMFGSKLREKYTGVDGNEWILTHLPSIKEEPYVNNYYDFIEQMRFQLTGYYKRDDMGILEFVSSLSSWKKLASEYQENVNFLGRKAFAKKQIEQILDGTENDWEKIQKIYDYIKTNVKWDEKYRIYPRKSAPQLIEEKVGNSAEINYLLVLLLREAGLNANPALTRTNNRGLLQKKYPLMSQFNQVLTCVDLNGQKVFMDATSKYRPYDLLAVRDLNYHSLVLEKNNPHWEKVLPPERNKQHLNLFYDLSDIENPACKFIALESGYFAAKSREELDGENKLNWLKDYIDVSEVEIDEDSVQIKNRTDVNKSLEGEVCFPMTFNWDSDLIYFSPFPEQIGKNPFLAESRQYRIDFNYKRSQNILMKILLPDNYSFEEYPLSKCIELPNKKGRFTLVTKVLGKELIMRTSYAIYSPSLSKEYYQALREFYTQMTKLLNSQVVIKKNKNT